MPIVVPIYGNGTLPFVFTPPPRFPPLTGSWTDVRIEEAPVETGPWTVIDTLPVAADTDPTEPQARSFSTTHATLEHGWYRVTWLDALGRESLPTEPLPNVAPAVNPELVLAAVESLMRARLIEGGNFTAGTGERAEHFTSRTNPTRARALEVATREAFAAARDYPRASVEDHEDLVSLAALRAAIELEGSSYPDQVETGRSPARFWRDLLNDRLKRLDVRMPVVPDTDPETPGVQGAAPIYAFPPATPLGW
jgi:hypothetical protein